MVERVVAAFVTGEPVILPTDTVYGLCSTPEHAGKLAALKKRPALPVALLCADLEALYARVPEARGRVEALLPGPYTVVLPNPAARLETLGGGKTIGVRVPLLPEPARSIVAAVGAVAATSANLHDGPDPARVEDVPAEIRAACAVVVDGGPLPGVPSTVVDLTGPEPLVLREGAVPAAEALARLE